MSKMSELALAVEELRKCGDALIGVADTLADLFSGGTETHAESAHAAPEPKTIRLEEVRAVLADKSRAGFTADVRALLQKYGADKLSKIDPANYAALLADAEVLGNG
ncbi:MAG: DNA ligase [Oscillospiraceae bacterium]